MARVEIRKKCNTTAREAARKDSSARITGRSVFIKRLHGKYWIMGMEVSKRQRTCRDLFADAQKLASRDLQGWNRKRHWGRIAKRHKVKGAHRMAVSYFYKLLKENGGELDEALYESRLCQRAQRSRVDRHTLSVTINKAIQTKAWKKMDEESPFYYKKFRDIEEYYEAALRLAS